MRGHSVYRLKFELQISMTQMIIIFDPFQDLRKVVKKISKFKLTRIEKLKFMIYIAQAINNIPN